MKVPNTSGVIWRVPVIVTYGNQGTVEMKSSQLAPNNIAE